MNTLSHSNGPEEKTPTQFKFRLFVAGNAPSSVKAIANLDAFFRQHFPGPHELEVVDVLREPNRALASGIFLTPTLVKFSPDPTVKIVGTLSEPEKMLHALART